MCTDVLLQSLMEFDHVWCSTCTLTVCMALYQGVFDHISSIRHCAEQSSACHKVNCSPHSLAKFADEQGWICYKDVVTAWDIMCDLHVGIKYYILLSYTIIMYALKIELILGSEQHIGQYSIQSSHTVCSQNMIVSLQQLMIIVLATCLEAHKHLHRSLIFYLASCICTKPWAKSYTTEQYLYELTVTHDVLIHYMIV